MNLLPNKSLHLWTGTIWESATITAPTDLFYQVSNNFTQSQGSTKKQGSFGWGGLGGGLGTSLYTRVHYGHVNILPTHHSVATQNFRAQVCTSILLCIDKCLGLFSQRGTNLTRQILKGIHLSGLDAPSQSHTVRRTSFQSTILICGMLHEVYSLYTHSYSKNKWIHHPQLLRKH